MNMMNFKPPRMDLLPVATLWKRERDALFSFSDRSNSADQRSGKFDNGSDQETGGTNPELIITIPESFIPLWA